MIYVPKLKPFRNNTLQSFWSISLIPRMDADNRAMAESDRDDEA
jgi:hypothetical protein